VSTIRPAAARAPATATCGGCAARWATVGDACHCPACHHTFADVPAFDAHHPDAGCVDPATITGPDGQPALSPDGGGMWRTATGHAMPGAVKRPRPGAGPGVQIEIQWGEQDVQLPPAHPPAHRGGLPGRR
jgi:hypothetical protein